MNRENSLNPKEVLSGKRTFYAKRCQNNGYYPVSMFVYNENQDAWENFDKKNDGWKSCGCAYPKPSKYGDNVITNRSWWEYIFENYSYILSYEEMTDTSNFNNK